METQTATGLQEKKVPGKKVLEQIVPGKFGGKAALNMLDMEMLNLDRPMC